MDETVDAVDGAEAPGRVDHPPQHVGVSPSTMCMSSCNNHQPGGDYIVVYLIINTVMLDRACVF